jgi:glycyl-tRNA synthetase
MFKTVIGPIEEEGEATFLRPETAQNIFVDYKNVLQSTNVKVPFGIAQIGKAFRNEITTGNFIFRVLEFEQMEIEYFIDQKKDWNQVFESWVGQMHGFAKLIGLDLNKLHDVEIGDKDRAFYSKRTIDMEYDFPFGQDELWGLAYRTDYDLSNHQKSSGVDLTYFDAKINERYLPHVIEPTFGVDRTVLAVLSEAFVEETLEKGDTRVVLKLQPEIAPYKVAVFPLLANKENLVEKAREICRDLKKNHMVFWDDRGNIGKRYRYQDEIGTPFCVTVDFDTLENGIVTVRDRDTMRQDAVKVEELNEYLAKKIYGHN